MRQRELTRGFQDQLNTQQHAALARLFNAYRNAGSIGSPLTDMAEGIASLRSCGATDSDLLCLVKHGLARHGRYWLGEDGEVFWHEADCRVTADSYFVLSEAGARLAEQGSPSPEQLVSTASKRENGASRPHWDDQQGALTLGGRLVKRFDQQAENQRAVLRAFQRQRWPRSIKDPLASGKDKQDRRVLNDTIKRLNRSQRDARIRFHGNGTGNVVLWEALS